MGLFDKISNLIFEENPNDEKNGNKSHSSHTKKGSWTDIFFEEVQEKSEESSEKRTKSFLDIFFEEVPEEKSKEGKKRKFSDIFFEEVSDDNIKSTFVEGEEKVSVLEDISSKIERRESELINLAEFFKTVNPNDYPDSTSEYEAYLSLVKQLNSIKELSTSSKNSAINTISNYQLESSFKKFELDYQSHINAIQSLCYLSEIATLNTQMQDLFSSNFTNQTPIKIAQTEEYVLLISKKSDKFDKKYSGRLYKELIEAEYRLTLLKLMNELKNGRDPRKNPFSGFSAQKKKTFETYLSKDLRESNAKYNTIADNKEKYIKYRLVGGLVFDKLDADAEVISEKINKYTIDDFLLNELLDNGEGFETLKSFLRFKLSLNLIDSKTEEADKRYLDDNYRKATSNRSSIQKKASNKTSNSFPDYEEL